MSRSHRTRTLSQLVVRTSADQVASYDGFSAGALTAYIPMLFKSAFGGSYNSAFYIQNVDSANTANITIKYYDSTGALSCTVNDTVAALASKGYWVPGLAASCLPAGWVGGVVVTSDQPIVANGRPHIGAEVMTYDSFSSGSLTSYLPMLFKGAFGGTYNSAFYVQNVDTANTANLSIKYYDSTGALTCTVTGETVAPLASKGYWLPGTCVPAGWVGGVEVTSDQPIVTVGRPHIGTHRSRPTMVFRLVQHPPMSRCCSRMPLAAVPMIRLSMFRTWVLPQPLFPSSIMT